MTLAEYKQRLTELLQEYADSIRSAVALDDYEFIAWAENEAAECRRGVAALINEYHRTPEEA